ncbi:MAG: prepilin-type N-terminal cleavage/methylation domain-containing protein [Elusimicrobiota bacterium]
MKTKKGFTLIELMIVVAIIGVLAAVAIPKFTDLIKKAKEGATKGSLGAFRSALTIYYGEQEGIYPYADTTAGGTDGASGSEASTFASVSGPFMTKYIDRLPSVRLGLLGTADTTATIFGTSAEAADVNIAANQGKWWYLGAAIGDMRVICSATDSKGTLITSW